MPRTTSRGCSASATSSSGTATARTGCSTETARQLALAHGLRGHRPRRRAEDQAEPLRSACATRCRSRTARSWRSPSSSIRARRRSPIRCPPRSAAGCCAPAGRARWSIAHPQGPVVKTTSVSGFWLLYLLAKLQPLRRRSLRFAAEEAASAWLDLVAATAQADYALALQVARMRTLVKGYGDTHARGRQVRPALALLPELRDARPPELKA